MSHTPNFLETAQGPHVVHPRRWLFGVLLAIGVLVIGVVVFLRPVRGALRAWHFAQAGKEMLLRAEELGAAGDLKGTDASLEMATEDFQNASVALEPLRRYQKFPWIGTQIRSVDQLLASGVSSITAAREVLSFATDLEQTLHDIESARSGLSPDLSPTVTLAALTPEEKRMILARFVASVPKLERASEKINQAMEEFEKIPTTGVAAPLARAIAPLGAKLPRLRDDIARALPLAKLLPTLAGYPAPKHSLILFLNNTELRPGGGFIGTIGRLDVSAGTVSNLATLDSYSLDQPAEKFLNIAPPTPFVQYLGVSRWFMRDANWSPDFRVSAENVAQFYERESNGGAPKQTIDDVIAFTPTFASNILKITGPITVDNQTFTAENLADTLEYQVEKGFNEKGIPYEQRKDILVKLVDQTMQKLLSLPFSRFEEVLAVIDQGFKEKQLMVYDRNTKFEPLIDEQGWSGAVDFGLGANSFDWAIGRDFFMVVDANLGSLKSDPVVKREINYHVVPDGDRLRATVSITYNHQGHFDWKTTRYRTYTRLYVPVGSEFIEANGMLKDDRLKNPRGEAGVVDQGPATDLGWGENEKAMVLGAFISIEPGESRTLSFTYRLPKKTSQGVVPGSCYELATVKQLGAAAYKLTLDLDFGKTLVRAIPPESTENLFDTRYRMNTNLDQDKNFEVCF